MAIKKIKVSELPLSQTLAGLFTIGVDSTNKSVKVSLEYLKTQADKVAAAEAAAIAANTAAGNANLASDQAGTSAADATTAAGNANGQALLAAATIARMEELAGQIVALYKLQPTSMTLSFPDRITIRNTAGHKIGVQLFPVDALQNVLFVGDDNAVSVMPDGSITVKKTGISKIHVIPAENTKIYRTIQVTVVEPALRRVKPNSLRLMGNGYFRLT